MDNLRFASPSCLKEHVRAHSFPVYTGEKGEGKRTICDIYNDGEHLYARLLREDSLFVFVRLPFKEFHQSKSIFSQDYDLRYLFAVPEGYRLFFRIHGHVLRTSLGHIGLANKEEKLVWFHRFAVPEGHMDRILERGTSRKFLRTEMYLIAQQ